MTLIAPEWDVVAASTVGRGHQLSRRGSQDAWAARRQNGFAVAVVCDGCSGGTSSEIGAGLGARFVAAELTRLLLRPPLSLHKGCGVDVAEATISALVEMLRGTAASCSSNDDDVAEVIASCLLFTVQAAFIGPERYCVFGVGDGLVRINGIPVPVPDAHDGAPDCPAYRLVEGLQHHAPVRVHAQGDTAALQSIVVASDGALELEALTSTTLANGDLFGGVAAFEQEQRFVSNPSLATKCIAALGPKAPADDCSVVVLRRRNQSRGTP